MTWLRERAVLQEQTPPQEVAYEAPTGGGGQPADHREAHVLHLDLWRALRVYRGLALTIALAGLAAAVYIAVSTWPVYKAQSQVYIQPAAPKVLDQTASPRWGSDASSYESFIQQQVQSVTQPPVLLGAIHKLTPGDWQRGDESDAAAAERLGKAIKTERIGGSYQITITAIAASADGAAKVANALAASLIENVSRQEKAGNPERIAMLKEERDRIQSELNSDRTEQETLSKQLGMAAVGNAAPNLFENESNAIRAELVKARTEHDEAVARLGVLTGAKDGSSRSMDAMADEVLASDAGLNSLKTTLDQRRAVLLPQMANLTPSNPQYKQDVAELAQIDASQEEYVKNLRAKVSARIEQRLRSDLARTAQVEERLNAQWGAMAATAVSATSKLQRANDLETNILRLQNRFTAVDDQLHNMLIENSAPGAAFLSAAATPPLHPTYSGLLRKPLPIALGSILLGILAAVIALKLDTRLYTASDVERVLGFAPMAQLPDFDQVSAGVAEEHIFRLAAAIEHAHQSGNLRSCIFTGIGPGAGVTTIVSQVRVMLGAMGRSSTLVDTSGTPPPPASPAESGSAGSTSLVAAQRGSRSSAVLQKFAEEKQAPAQGIILTDTAPLPISAETEYLARFVDATIIVVESGVTTRAQLHAVANTLQQLEVTAVGFVLNRVRLKRADPVFRQSVLNMERHQHSQSRASRLRAEREHPAFAAVAAQEAPESPAENPGFVPLASLAAEVAAKAQSFGTPARPAPSPSAAAPASPPPAGYGVPRSFVDDETSKTPPAQPQSTPLPRASRSRSDYEDLAYRFEMALEQNRERQPESPLAPPPITRPTPESEAAAPTGPTRLESLRRMNVAAEMKNFHKTPAANPADSFAQPAPSAAERSWEPSSIPPPAKQPLWPISGPSSLQATAPPEILPPKPILDEPLKETARTFTSAGRRNQTEDEDEMQTLPFKRGQYQGRR
jgi:uncharacterized protein involved in exopolysaccharide biosynthesis